MCNLMDMESKFFVKQVRACTSVECQDRNISLPSQRSLWGEESLTGDEGVG